MASSQTPAKEKFNKDQHEGFARILDGIAQAYVIGITIGSVGFTEHKISIWIALMLSLCRSIKNKFHLEIVFSNRSFCR